MKKTRMYLVMMAIMAAVSILAWSCSTKDNVKPATPTTYTFKINGHSFTEAAASDSATDAVDASGTKYHVLAVSGQSTDKTQTGLLEFIFPGSAKPGPGVYKIVGGQSTLSANQVAVLAFTNISKAEAGLLGATGADNVSATVSISSSGKISVAMPQIALKGTNIDNTDPNNTVSTDITGTASGTVSE